MLIPKCPQTARAGRFAIVCLHYRDVPVQIQDLPARLYEKVYQPVYVRGPQVKEKQIPMLFCVARLTAKDAIWISPMRLETKKTARGKTCPLKN